MVMRSTDISTGRLNVMTRMPLVRRISVSVSSAKRNTSRPKPALVLTLTSALAGAASARSGNISASAMSSSASSTTKTAKMRSPSRGGTWASSCARIARRVRDFPAILETFRRTRGRRKVSRMAGKSLTLRAIRAHDDAQVPPRLGLRIFAVFVVLEALLLIALALIFPLRADAAPAKAEVSVSTSAGFGRLVFRFAEETETDIRLTNGILVITFKRPVEISVDRITIGAPDYVNAARRDPDGTAVRMALARKVTVNSMVAGERLFVDLLPDGWVGLPPGLPQEVVDELARRAHEAEKNEIGRASCR